jgi:hypothetical protein
MTEFITITFEDLEPYLHQYLQIRFNPDVVLDAEVIELVRLDKYDELPRDPFMFILRTKQKQEYFPQAIFTILHPVKGEIPVFLVPLGPDTIGMKYQAIFN